MTLKDFNVTGGGDFNSVHELINTCGMEAVPQAMKILFNEANSNSKFIIKSIQNAINIIE